VERRTIFTTAVELGGLLCFCLAGFESGVVVGLVVTGICLEWLGYSLR
jgi:hypothetical protein